MRLVRGTALHILWVPPGCELHMQASPAEGAGVILCKESKKMFQEVETQARFKEIR